MNTALLEAAQRAQMARQQQAQGQQPRQQQYAQPAPQMQPQGQGPRFSNAPQQLHPGMPQAQTFLAIQSELQQLKLQFNNLATHMSRDVKNLAKGLQALKAENDFLKQQLAAQAQQVQQAQQVLYGPSSAPVPVHQFVMPRGTPSPSAQAAPSPVERVVDAAVPAQQEIEDAEYETAPQDGEAAWYEGSDTEDEEEG